MAGPALPTPEKHSGQRGALHSELGTARRAGERDHIANI